MDGTHSDVTQASGGIELRELAAFRVPKPGHGSSVVIVSAAIVTRRADPHCAFGVHMKSTDSGGAQPLLAAILPDGSTIVSAKRVRPPSIRRIALRAGEPNVTIWRDGYTRHDIFGQTILGGQNLKSFFFEAR